MYRFDRCIRYGGWYNVRTWEWQFSGDHTEILARVVGSLHIAPIHPKISRGRFFGSIHPIFSQFSIIENFQIEIAAETRRPAPRRIPRRDGALRCSPASPPSRPPTSLRNPIKLDWQWNMHRSLAKQVYRALDSYIYLHTYLHAVYSTWRAKRSIPMYIARVYMSAYRMDLCA